MTVSTVDTLTEYAQAVLDVAEAATATTDAGVPDQVFLSSDTPSIDCCPALVVEVARLAEAPTSPLGPPEAQALRTTVGNVILATYVITVTRCIDIGINGIPSLAAKHAAAVEVQQDGWAVWNAIRHALADGVLFDLCEGAHFDFWTPLKEQGGCVGGTMQLRAMIPGIPNPPGT